MRANIKDLSFDWNRSVFLTGRIGEELVARLTPQILKLRQQSNDPITVAIDSFGGSVATIDTLRGLLTGPDQDGNHCSTVAVVTNQALSAAASFLALSDHAVALPHSSILFHDVRYGGMEDVTPDKARTAARQLQRANETFALRIANSVFRRMSWLYIDLRPRFDQFTAGSPVVERFRAAVNSCGASPTAGIQIDIASLAATLHRLVSTANEGLIENAMARLGRWGVTTNTATHVPMYQVEGGEPGLLDGPLNLVQQLQKGRAEEELGFGGDGRAEDLRLFLTIAMAHVAFSKGTMGVALESAIADFTLMESINDPSHLSTAARLMLRHKSIFFAAPAVAVLDGDDSAAKSRVMAEVQPYVKVLWLLCVLLCRELVTGEHMLSPRDALMLGIVDEVPGDDVIESKREFRIRHHSLVSANDLPRLPPRRLRPRIKK